MIPSTGAAALLLACALVGGALGAPAIAAEPARIALNPPQLPDTTRYGYSQATVVAPGTTLTAAGSSPDDVVRITLLIMDHDPARLAYLVEKRRAFFGASPPASTLIPVPALYAPDVSFEIDAVAVVSAAPR